MAFAFLFFDSVGGGEWLVLLAVVLIVVGPKNLPAAARKMGQILAQLRRAADEFKRQIMTMDQEMEKTMSDVKQEYIDMAKEVDRAVTEEAETAASGGEPSSPDLDGADRAEIDYDTDYGDGDDGEYDGEYDGDYGSRDAPPEEGVSEDTGPSMADAEPEGGGDALDNRRS